MAENTEGEVLENLKKDLKENTEGEVLENLKKVNESLSRVVNMLQSSNTTKSVSSTSLACSSVPKTSSIFAEQRLFGNAAVRTNPRVNQIEAALRFRPLSSGTTHSTATTGKKRAKRTAGGFRSRTKRNQWTHEVCRLAEKKSLQDTICGREA